MIHKRKKTWIKSKQQLKHFRQTYVQHNNHYKPIFLQ